MKLLSITVLGSVLAHPKIQAIPKPTFKLLSKLVFALFLPCLIFIHLGQSITLDTVARWWFIPVNVVVSTLIGCILGYLVVLVCHPPPQFVRLTIIMTAFGNTGNLPIAIIGSLCHSKDNPFGPDCRRKGVAYVSFAQWVSVILVYTLIYHMMEPPVQYYEIVYEEEEEEQQRPDVTQSQPLLVDAEWPGMDDKVNEHSKTPFIANVFRSVYAASSSSHSSFPANNDHTTSMGCLAEPRMVQKMRIVAEQTSIRHILQPPKIASLLAVLVGMVPQMRSFVFGQDAPLSFLTDSLEIVAGPMVPSVMLILGGMLAEGPTKSTLGLRTTIGISVARLLILPVIGIGIVYLADKVDILVQGDPMYRFVLLIRYTTPSAILLGATARLRGYAVAEASALVFWQHLFALFSLCIHCHLLGSYFHTSDSLSRATSWSDSETWWVVVF